MRRFPFYAYPNSFYASPAEASHHRPPRRPFSPASSPARPPAPTPRSVINVPVFDSAPSRPSSSPPQRPPAPAVVPLIDPSSAATTIQSHFRGFCVRRHHPLLHLRSIATARKQLEELQSELERPEFALRLRASEKERLRFSESAMAIILRLDAIEGPMAEVRSQRKEATKMAIKLQDAIDAIIMQKDEIAALNPTADKVRMAPNDCGLAPSDDSVLFERPQEPLCPEVSANGIMDVNTLQEKPLSPEDEVADKCMPNLDNNDVTDVVAENVSPLHPREIEDLGQQREAGSGHVESVLQVQPAKAMYSAEQDVFHVTGENAEQDKSHVTGGNADSDVTHAAEEEVENGIDALHLETHKNHMQSHVLAVKVDHDTCVDDMIDAGDGCAEKESYTCRDVVQEGKEGFSQDVELCQHGTPTAHEKCDFPRYYSDAAHGNELQGPLTSLERLTEGDCYSDGHNFATLHTHAYQERSDNAHANRSNEANSCDEVKAQASSLSMAGTLWAKDNAILHQLSEDCRQLKSLVGKLLVQNKAQSNILWALGERLEMLEHQQQRSCKHNQQKMRDKRKLKKGTKRSVKCHNCE